MVFDADAVIKIAGGTGLGGIVLALVGKRLTDANTRKAEAEAKKADADAGATTTGALIEQVELAWRRCGELQGEISTARHEVNALTDEVRLLRIDLADERADNQRLREENAFLRAHAVPEALKDLPGFGETAAVLRDIYEPKEDK